MRYPRSQVVGQEFPYRWLVEKDMSRFMVWISRIREQSWLHDFDGRSLEEFAYARPQRIRFVLDEHQYRLVEDALTLFGHTPHGRAKAIIRIGTNTLWRQALPVESAALPRCGPVGGTRTWD
jgi:hypothetical protein